MSRYNQLLQSAAASFIADVDRHEMTVLREDGLYRHIHFSDPKTSFEWFDLITWPGYLAFVGDRQSHVFARVTDMFTFFRAKSGWNNNTINPKYWAEKLTSDRGCTQGYDPDLFQQTVREHVAEAIRSGAPRGLARAVLNDVLDGWIATDETSARAALDQFDHHGWQFADTWEWDLREWDFHYLWACNAIQWGIGQYDAARVPAEAVAA